MSLMSFIHDEKEFLAARKEAIAAALKENPESLESNLAVHGDESIIQKLRDFFTSKPTKKVKVESEVEV